MTLSLILTLTTIAVVAAAVRLLWRAVGDWRCRRRGRRRLAALCGPDGEPREDVLQRTAARMLATDLGADPAHVAIVHILAIVLAINF